MIKGLTLFRDHFAGLEEQYILIGGAACDIQMAQAQIQFRATHDLDIVLCVEALTPDFGRKFWEFIHLGGYQAQEKSDGIKRFYRFKNPTSDGFPDMLELFSRKPDVFEGIEMQGLTPIPLPDEVSSLSAILLDEDYYTLMLSNRITKDGISLLTPGALVVLKAKAWLDLSERRMRGEHVDSRDVKKHRNDILRLCATLSPEMRITLSGETAVDMAKFLSELTIERQELHQLGIHAKPEDLIVLLTSVLDMQD